MKDTLSVTNTLRGIGILVVLVNHYLTLNITGDNRGFAQLWIAVFFIVSGYGINYSLSRSSFKDGIFTFQKVFYLLLQ